MQTILLPTDFSNHSNKAIEFAIEIAKLSNAKIIVTHAFHLPIYDVNIPTSMMEDLYDQEKTETEQKLKDLCKKISSHTGIDGKKLETNFSADLNTPLSEISSIARKKKIDLIIIGTEGETQFLSSLGSTTVGLLDMVDCPVLVVKENTPFNPFNKITFAIENIEEDLASIKQLIPLAQLFNSEVSIIHAEKYPDSINELSNLNDRKEYESTILNKLIEDLNYSNIKFEYVFSDNTYDKLLSLLNKTSNLVTLLKYHRSWLDSLFHKSIINASIHKSNLPLLILHKDLYHFLP
jgi:nucleotide-binding universal stress UspA family protein